MFIRLAVILALLGGAGPAYAQHWVTSWAGSAQGPYPSGRASAQPDLRFALPDPEAKEQTFRLIIRPSVWGTRMRLRFSNAFGAKPVSFDGAFLGLQWSGAAVTPGTNRPVTFGGRKSVTVPPGGQVWSDAVTLPWVKDPAAAELLGRKLAVSFHVAGPTGPMTWHAQAMQTSYLTAPGAGALGELEDESAFPFGPASWFFVDALDVQAGPELGLVVCFGGSVTDGANATLNGDDRWPDALSRRLRAAGLTMSVANAGISGNQVAGPAGYAPDKPFAGGPAATARLDRDVAGLSGVTHVIWLEGIEDLGAGAATLDQVRDAMRAGVKRLRERLRGVKVYGATLTGAAPPGAAQLPPETEGKRRAFNEWLRNNNGGLFDGVIEFDRATSDPNTGALRPEFVPGSTGGAGDGLNPNRAGYIAMSDVVSLRLLRPPAPPRPRPVAPPAVSPAVSPATTPATGDQSAGRGGAD